MCGNRLVQLIHAIADGLRKRQMERVAEYLGETYRGSLGAGGFRAVDRAIEGTDATAAEHLKHVMDGTGQLAHREDEQPDFGLPGHEARPRDRRDAPLLVADELERIHQSRAQARWQPLETAASPWREFEAWMISPVERPLPPLSVKSGLNCWEMLLWAGVRSQVIAHADVHRIYAPLAEGRRVGALSFRTKWELLPDEFQIYPRGQSTGLPLDRGVLIVWGESAHAAIATGRTSRDGSPEVYSFWPPPKHEFTVDPNTGSRDTVTDAVQITSIDELHPFINPPSRTTSRQILFGRGPW